MKNFLCIISLLFLSGCGNDIAPAEVDTTQFKIADNTFSTTIPKDWNNIPLRTDQGEVFMAEKGDENFIILRKKGDTSNIKNIILSDLQQNLFAFSLLDQSDDQWHFIGKLSAETPQREFYQKVIPILGTDQYLWGSCSFEPYADRKTDCASILKNWKTIFK